MYKQILDELRATQTEESSLTEKSNLNTQQPNENRAPQDNSNDNNGRILFWENNQSPELELVRKWNLLSNCKRDEKTQLIDNDLAKWLPPKKKNINKMPPVQQKHHRLNSKRRRQFALIQKLYKKNKGAAIRKILDDEWDTNHTEKPSLEKLEPY